MKNKLLNRRIVSLQYHKAIFILFLIHFSIKIVKSSHDNILKHENIFNHFMSPFLLYFCYTFYLSLSNR